MCKFYAGTALKLQCLCIMAREFGTLLQEHFLKEHLQMSETCTHDCSSCKSNCDHRAPQHEPPHAQEAVSKKSIGVVSGKGGVGKRA